MHVSVGVYSTSAVLVCKATAAVSNEAAAKCCFSNLFVFMYCMRFPAGVGAGT